VPRQAPEALTCTENRRTESTVTWALKDRGEPCGYLRFDHEAHLLYLRVFHARGTWSDERNEELRQLPRPLVGELDVRREGAELICRMSHTFSPDSPNALEATLEHFLSLRSVTVEQPLSGAEALDDLTTALASVGIEVPAIARSIPGLVKVSPWCWGTRLVPPFTKLEGHLELQPVQEAMLATWDRRPLFALSQQVHGSNTYLNLTCSLGPVAVAADVQVGWYGEKFYPLESRQLLTRLFALVDGLPRDEYASPGVLVCYSGYSLDARFWLLRDFIPTCEQVDFWDAEADLGDFFSYATE
jgi:hypothetical protein